MENEEIKVENQETPTPSVEETEIETPKQEEVSEKTQSFTQEQVNDIVRDRLNRVYNRYGVKDSKELDDLMGKAQSYNVFKERVNEYRKTIGDLSEKLAFIENNIEPTRYDDIRAYFKGKGIDFNDEALKTELATHPEWKKIVEESSAPITTIQRISPDRVSVTPSTNEKDETAKMFGFKNGFVR